MTRPLKYAGLALAVALLLLANELLVPRGPVDRKVDAYFAAMIGDLRNLSVAQASFYETHGRFTTALDSLELLPGFGVRIAVVGAGAAAWESVVTHDSMPTRCVYGESLPLGNPPAGNILRQYCHDAP